MRKAANASPDRQQLPDEVEARFYSAIGKFINQYGWFDYNVGLQLNYWSNGKLKNVKKYLTINSGLKDRLDALTGMVNKSTNPVTAAESSEYQQWVGDVESIRGLRNDYAHGRWVHSATANKDDIDMTFVPMQWNASQRELRPTVTISLSELERQVTQLSKLTDQIPKVLVPYLEFRRTDEMIRT